MGKHAREILKPLSTGDTLNGDVLDSPVFGDHGDRAAQTLATLGLLVSPASDCPSSPGVSLRDSVGNVATNSSSYPHNHQSTCSSMFVAMPPSQSIQFHTAVTPVFVYQ